MPNISNAEIMGVLYVVGPFLGILGLALVAESIYRWRIRRLETKRLIREWTPRKKKVPSASSLKV